MQMYHILTLCCVCKTMLLAQALRRKTAIFDFSDPLKYPIFSKKYLQKQKKCMRNSTRMRNRLLRYPREADLPKCDVSSQIFCRKLHDIFSWCARRFVSQSGAVCRCLARNGAITVLQDALPECSASSYSAVDWADIFYEVWGHVLQNILPVARQVSEPLKPFLPAPFLCFVLDQAGEDSITGLHFLSFDVLSALLVRSHPQFFKVNSSTALRDVYNAS